MATDSDQDSSGHPTLAGLQAELREGLASVRKSMSDLSEGLRLDRQHHQQSLRDVLMAIGRLSADQQQPRRALSPSPSTPYLSSDTEELTSDGEPAAKKVASRRSASRKLALGDQRIKSMRATKSSDLDIDIDMAEERAPGTGNMMMPERTRSRRDWYRGGEEQGTNSFFSLGGLGLMELSFKVRARYFRKKTKQFLKGHGSRLDIVVGFLIVFNAVCIGIEIQSTLDGSHISWLKVLEHIFLVLFFIELCVRVVGDDGNYLWSFWFFLDFTMIALGMIFTWLVAPILTSAVSDNELFRILNQILVLRIFRLLRLGRTLRHIEFFEEVWKLCNGLLKSAKTVLIACAMVLTSTYIFACLGVEAMQHSTVLRANPTTNDIIEDRFSSLPRMMLTLLSFANADSIASVYEPIVAEDPRFAVFFALEWLFVTVTIMNLVTAVIVDTAMWQSKSDHEQKNLELRKLAKRLVPEIESLFEDLDVDQTGMLERSELSLAGISLQPKLKELLGGDERKLVDLFSFLDYDNSNTVDKQEFVDGIMHLILQSVPIETTQTLQVLRSQRHCLSRLRKDLKGVHLDVSGIHGELHQLRASFGDSFPI